MVGPDDKVGLVGRNGTGKSSLVSVICGQAPAHLRVAGDVDIQGTIGFLPQVPTPGGLGLEPTGFSHVLSARGLDVLDEELHRPARGERRPHHRGHRHVLRPRGALRRRRRLQPRRRDRPAGRGHRAAPGHVVRRHRLAVGRSAPARRHRAGPVRPARHPRARRAHQPPRPRRQALAQRRAVALPGGDARHQPRPQVARQRHHQGPEPGRRRTPGVQGQLHVLPGPAQRRHRAAGEEAQSSRTARSASSAPWPTPCGPAPRTGPARRRCSTAGSSA